MKQALHNVLLLSKCCDTLMALSINGTLSTSRPTSSKRRTALVTRRFKYRHMRLLFFWCPFQDKAIVFAVQIHYPDGQNKGATSCEGYIPVTRWQQIPLLAFHKVQEICLPNPDKANYRVVSWVLCDCDDATRVKLIHSFLRQLFPTIIVNFVLSKSGNAKDCDVMPLIVIELGWDGRIPSGWARRKSRFHCWLYMMMCLWKIDPDSTRSIVFYESTC